MEQTIIELINKISEIAPQMFEIMVRQAYSQGIATVIMCVATMILSIVLGFILIKAVQTTGVDELAIIILFPVAGFIIAFFKIQEGILQILNPEYYAIMNFIDKLR